jgi:hypothetical protein
MSKLYSSSVHALRFNPILVMIRGYQKVSRLSGFQQVFGVSCRYKPTCSEYTYEAVKRYGTMKGLLKGFKRILRCNPWTKGGWDPVK